MLRDIFRKSFLPTVFKNITVHMKTDHKIKKRCHEPSDGTGTRGGHWQCLLCITDGKGQNAERLPCYAYVTKMWVSVNVDGTSGSQISQALWRSELRTLLRFHRNRSTRALRPAVFVCTWAWLLSCHPIKNCIEKENTPGFCSNTLNYVQHVKAP